MIKNAIFGLALSVLPATVTVHAQVSQSETILTKGLIFNQTSPAAPAQANQNAAIFEASLPGLDGPSGPLAPGASLVLPGGAKISVPYDDSEMVFVWDATNNTPSGLSATYPAGHYGLVLTSKYLSTSNGVDLPSDNFPAAPQFSNYAAAQQIDPTKDFSLLFSPFSGAASPDDSSIEIDNSAGSVVLSDTPDLAAGSYTISQGLLASGQTYSVHLRFRRLSVTSSSPFPSASGFFSETVMTIATTGGNSGNTPPNLTNSVPLAGETILAGTPLVLQFDEAMDQTIAIQWSESINGTSVPLNGGDFTYVWTDSHTLACFYGGVGGAWPGGALFSWALNPVPGAATNFSSTAGLALASGTYSGNFLTPGGPWACAAQVNNPIEAPAFYVVKAGNYVQLSGSPPMPDANLGDEFLAFLQIPDNGSAANPPLVIVSPPSAAVSASGGVVLPLHETSGDLLAGHFRYLSATSANGLAALDSAFPAGNYVMEMASENTAVPQSLPVPTNSVSLSVAAGSYPPVPQFTNANLIPLNTITNGLTVSWLPWSGAPANGWVEFQVLDAASNVVFSAPDSCRNLALPASASSVVIPPNLLSVNVPYQIALSFMSLSDSNKYLTNIPGAGYAALSSVTRMSLLAYMSPPPTVAITSPGSGSFVPSGSLSVQVTAAQPSGFLSQLQLFSGTILIATLPLGAGVTNFSGAISGSISAGPQSLFVVATDGNGQTATAGPVSIMAQSANFLVALSNPSAGATYPPFPAIALTAGASSPNGPITNMDFFMDGNLIGSLSAAPFDFTVSQVYPGAHQFYVHAFDTSGFGGASVPIAVTVAAPGGNMLTPFFSTNDAFSFGFTGQPGAGYVLEAATNLAAPVNWVPVQSKLLSSAQGVFSDAGYADFSTRFYRLAPLNASLSNQPAFSVWSQTDPAVTASDDYELSEGAFVALTNSSGAIFNFTLSPGALDLGATVTLNAVTNLQDYPFAGPMVAAAEIAPAEVDLFVSGNLVIELPTNVPIQSLVAFTYHVPNGELLLTPFFATNLITTSATNPAIAIPISRTGGYGVAALTAADLRLATQFPPSDPADSIDQATALSLLLTNGSAVRLNSNAGAAHIGSVGRMGGSGGVAGPVRPGSGRPGNPVGFGHEDLVQQLLDQFDVIYAQMQATEASGDIMPCQINTWNRWFYDLQASGLEDLLSIQAAQFTEALVNIYQVAFTKMILKADSQHDWSAIIKLIQVDLSGKLSGPALAQAWQPGQLEALQQALDDCLTFEFDFDSSFENDSSIGTETSHVTAQVTFQEGSPSLVHKVKGSAAVQWQEAEFPPIPPCDAATASPSTPDFQMFGIDPTGPPPTKNANCTTTYNVTGLVSVFWPGVPLENFTTTCEGYPAELADYWYPEFGDTYLKELQAFPPRGGQPQASFWVKDGWQAAGGGGNATLATRQGHGVLHLKGATVTETSTWTLKHTPQ